MDPGIKTIVTFDVKTRDNIKYSLKFWPGSKFNLLVLDVVLSTCALIVVFKS